MGRTLKWHPNYNIHAPWTQTAETLPQDWPKGMQPRKDYQKT